MIDEMSIKKHIQLVGQEVYGHIDIGNGVRDDSAPCATNALVFMLVAVNSNWKVPLAFFLITGLSGVERANLVTQY